MRLAQLVDLPTNFHLDAVDSPTKQKKFRLKFQEKT